MLAAPQLSEMPLAMETALLLSELTIAVCYFIIPVQMYLFMQKIQVAEIFTQVRVWFMLFIIFCGTTHLMGFLMRWLPVTELMVLSKIGTAAVSVGTVVVLVKHTHDLLNLLRQASELEESVRESSAALERLMEKNLELARLKEEAMQLAKTRQDFISTVSHEVRTPLQSIIGYGEILGQSRLDPSQGQMMQAMLGSARLLCTIINDILDFAKYQKSDFALENEPLSLRDAVVTSLRISSSKAQEKGIRLRFRFDTPVARFVTGDLTRLVQILSNLVSNSVKFTDRDGSVAVLVSSVQSAREWHDWVAGFNRRPFTCTPQPESSTTVPTTTGSAQLLLGGDGAVVVDVRSDEKTRLLDDKEDKAAEAAAASSSGSSSGSRGSSGGNDDDFWGVRIQVRDTGIGIPEVALQRIFQRFMQSDNSTTRKYGGTGLGLAIAQQLTQRMGGSVHLESREGLGATFTVFLPFQPTPGAELLPRMEDFELVRPPALYAYARETSSGAASASAGNGAGGAGRGGNGGGANAELLSWPREEDTRVHAETMFPPAAADGTARPQTLEQQRYSSGSELAAPEPLAAPHSTRNSHAPSSGGHAHPQAQDPQAQPQPTKPEQRALRIFVVDDNEINRTVTARMLHNIGVADVELAEDGQEAYERLVRKDLPRFDVVFMDLHMPVLDGTLTTERIRLNVRHCRDLIILAFTAATFSPDEAAKLRAVGFSGILFKPCTLDKLRQAVALVRACIAKEMPLDRVFQATTDLYATRG